MQLTGSKVEKFLRVIEEQYDTVPDDLHITRKAGALVAISGGRVIAMEEPVVKYCPLFKALFSQGKLSRESIEKKFSRQAREYGMFEPERKITDDKIVVPFGASEMIMYALKRGIVDTAVVVCEGAGTVITNVPGVVQGIGAYMNGIFYTSPIPEVIKRLEDSGSKVLDRKGAVLDQFGGVLKSLKEGSKNIVVTIRGDEYEVIPAIKKLERQFKAAIIILAVCNTGITREQAEVIREYADLSWSCASRYIREIVGPSALLQVGMKIPVFVTSRKGIYFISGYTDYNKIPDICGPNKKHYITSGRYETGGLRIKMGRFSVYLYETEKLPLEAADRPFPLI